MVNRLLTEMLMEWWLCVNQSVDGVLIECQWIVDPGSLEVTDRHSTTDALSTHDLRNNYVTFERWPHYLREYCIWSNLHMLSPSFIAFTSSRSPSLSKSRLPGFGECLFFLCWPCSSRSALLFALFPASSLVSKESNDCCCCRWLYVCLVASMVSVHRCPLLLDMFLVSSGFISLFSFQVSMGLFHLDI